METARESQKNLVSTIKCNTSKYFGININSNWYTYNVMQLLEVEEMNIISDNMLVDRNELEMIARGLFSKLDLTYTKIYISQNIVNSQDVQDSTGKTIFNGSDDLQGWLIFIDPIVIANWSHRCEYWFIVNKEVIIKKVNESWKPKIPVRLEEFILNRAEN